MELLKIIQTKDLKQMLTKIDDKFTLSFIRAELLTRGELHDPVTTDSERGNK